MTSIAVVDWFRGFGGVLRVSGLNLGNLSCEIFFPVSEKGVIQSVIQTARKETSEYSQ